MDAGIRVETLERERGLTHDILTVGSAKHMMHGLIEVDVTDARRRLGGLSLTAFLIHCMAVGLTSEPRLNAMRRGRRLYSFASVNVGMMIEREDDGLKKVSGIVIRNADTKAVTEIHSEIREAQRRPFSELARGTGAAWAVRMPGFVRRAALRYMLSKPALAHDMGLITGLTAVGMFGRGAGWGLLPVTPCTIEVTVGGIGQRVVLVDGKPEDHEFLCLTVSFDHDVIDGAPAARFTAALADLVESGHGLDSTLAQAA